VSTSRRLCALAALADGRAVMIDQADQSLEQAVLLVRRGDQVAAFVNRCPHMGFTLDWKAERLVIGKGAFLRCVHHGAVFRIADGLCVEGPCESEALTPVAVEIVDGEVVLAAEPACNP